MLATFDAPGFDRVLVKRRTSNAPIQSLTLWNDVVFFEAAQQLARRVVREVPLGMSVEQTIRARGSAVLRLCVGRVPSQAEIDDVISLYHDQLQLAGANSAGQTGRCRKRAG